jgi:hypothetical protein
MVLINILEREKNLNATTTTNNENKSFVLVD